MAINYSIGGSDGGDRVRAMQQLADLQRKKEMARKKEAEKLQAEQETAQNEPQRNWLNTAGTGAQIGTSISPGYGTAIGAAIGAGVGIFGSASNRRAQAKAHGKKMGWGSALGKATVRPAGDKWDGLSDIPVASVAATAGKYGSKSPSTALKGPNKNIPVGPDGRLPRSMSTGAAFGSNYTPSSSVQGPSVGGYSPQYDPEMQPMSFGAGSFDPNDPRFRNIG